MIANIISLFVTVEYPGPVDPDEVRKAVCSALEDSTKDIFHDVQEFTARLAE
jgi:hypothetical protein